jgi:hypothetical protein
MALILAEDELEVVRTALAEYAGALRERSHQHCANYSPVGIDLCRTRLKVEALLERLRHPTPPPADANWFEAGLPKRPA